MRVPVYAAAGILLAEPVLGRFPGPCSSLITRSSKLASSLQNYHCRGTSSDSARVPGACWSALLGGLSGCGRFFGEEGVRDGEAGKSGKGGEVYQDVVTG